MAALGRLTAGVAHDFNNLLAAIIGNAEILRSQLGDHSAHEQRVVVDSANRRPGCRSGATVAGVLTQAGTDAGDGRSEPDERACAAWAVCCAPPSDVATRVETKLDELLWPALVDPVQIEHVILNLAINARDAMPEAAR